LGQAAPPPPVGGGGTGPARTPVPGATPGAGGTPGVRTAAQLAQDALLHYNNAQEALKRSDWATYGQEINTMKADLDALAVLTGGAVPVGSPSPGGTAIP
ncbi:MAG: hypothetical protein ACJ78Q_10775, partial [Chloroflexia bacterium]